VWRMVGGETEERTDGKLTSDDMFSGDELLCRAVSNFDVEPTTHPTESALVH
jgi:hypothetical protein